MSMNLDRECDYFIYSNSAKIVREELQKLIFFIAMEKQLTSDAAFISDFSNAYQQAMSFVEMSDEKGTKKKP